MHWQMFVCLREADQVDSQRLVAQTRRVQQTRGPHAAQVFRVDAFDSGRLRPIGVFVNC